MRRLACIQTVDAVVPMPTERCGDLMQLPHKAVGLSKIIAELDERMLRLNAARQDASAFLPAGSAGAERKSN